MKQIVFVIIVLLCTISVVDLFIFSATLHTKSQFLVIVSETMCFVCYCAFGSSYRISSRPRPIIIIRTGNS